MSQEQNGNTGNVVVEDFLNVDAPIPGQAWTCLSFISPEKIIKQKEQYFAEKFVPYFINKVKLEQEKGSKGIKLLEEGVSGEDFEKHFNIEEMYKDFLYLQESRLTEEFSAKHEFQTCVRGLKIRGTYETRKEAEYRAKMLHKRDPNFHVFVGQVGYWLPWDPNPDEIKDQEFLDERLNQLMKNYQENRQQKDEFFQQEVAEKRREAIAENARRKQEQEADQPENIIQLKRKLEEEAPEKIAALRTLANEKDELLLNVPKVQMDGNALAGAGAGAGGDDDGTFITLRNKLEDNAHDALGDASNNADPWMERKKETIANDKTVPSTEKEGAGKEKEQVNDLKAIAKDLFGF